MIATLSRNALLEFHDGHSEIRGLNLSVSTHHSLQNSIMDEYILVLYQVVCERVCVCVCVCVFVQHFCVKITVVLLTETFAD